MKLNSVGALLRQLAAEPAPQQQQLTDAASSDVTGKEAAADRLGDASTPQPGRARREDGTARQDREEGQEEEEEELVLS